MKILVINAGSSSIKYQLFDMENETVMAKGLCDRIGIDGGNFKHAVPGRDDYKINVQMANHGEAVKLVIDVLTSGTGSTIGINPTIRLINFYFNIIINNRINTYRSKTGMPTSCTIKR